MMKHIIKKQSKKPVDEKKQKLIEELCEIYSQLGYEVRFDKGMFKGGFCLLREKKLFLINRTLEQDKKISSLLRYLSVLGTENVFVKPNIREMIDQYAGADEES